MNLHGETPSPARRLMRLLRPERSDILVILALSVLNGVLLLATPLAVDTLVNSIAFGGRDRVYVQALLVLSLALFAFLILLAVMRIAQHFVMEIIERRLFVRVSADLTYRLPRIQTEALDRTGGPELINRFFEIVTIQKAGSLLLLDGVNLVLSALIGLVVLAFFHPFLLAYDVLLAGFLVVVIFGMGRNAVSTSIRESYAKHAVAAWLEQIAAFPTSFKPEGGCKLAAQRADTLAHEYLAARRAHFRILVRQIGGLLILQAVASAALLVVAGSLVLRGELTLGQLVAAELIVGAIVASVAKFGKHLEALYDALAAVDKMGTLVDLPIEREGGEHPAPRAGGSDVRARAVRFGYDPHQPIFDGLSFEVSAGARIAVVGPAGYGASTLLDILFGLRQVSAGQIEIDGVDVRQWAPIALRDRVALVRGHEIVAGTIAENVRMGRRDMSAREVEQALECVGLGSAVLASACGIDTLLSLGGRPLSSSQRTRLMLARAIAGKPRLLLVDEALDGLDVATLAELEPHLFDRATPWTLLLATRVPDLVGRCDGVIHLGGSPLQRGIDIVPTS